MVGHRLLLGQVVTRNLTLTEDTDDGGHHQQQTDLHHLRGRRQLTERELEVLGWVCEGKTSAEIAALLNVAQSKARNQTQSILVKLRVNTRAQAAAKAIKKGLVVPRHPNSVFGSL
ncbi:MAG: response regulator transcription factor [Thiobacillus sp.]